MTGADLKLTRAARLGTAVVLALGFLVAPTPPAHAAVIWNDSPAFAVQTTNCITGGGEQLGTARVGWLGDPATPPPVNSVYYARIWWGITGNPCIGGARVAPELFLPDGTTLAISATNPVKCFARNFTTGASTPELTACPQAPSAGVRGGLGFYPVGQQNVTWPSPQGSGWEIQVPVLSTSNLNGVVTSTNATIPCPSCLTAGVWMIDGVQSPWATPRVGVKVTGGPTAPTITYPTPSTFNITGTTASGGANLARAGTTGSAYIETAAMPPGGSTCTATSNFFPITSSFNGQLVIGWTALSPGTTYYWRACYKTGNLTFWGSNQTLRTTGTPKPKLLSISRTFALPGQSVQINGSNLSGASIALVLGGSSTPATVTANTSESVTFTVPSLNSFVGYVQLTTAGGSVTSPPFQLGVDTIVDSTTVSDQDGNGQKDDVLIQFHVTEPFPFAEANCHLDTSPFMNSCRSGTVVYRDLAPGMHKVEITGYINHASGHWEDFSPAVANFVVTNADTTPPNTTLTTSPQQGSAVPATSVNLAYSSNEAGSKFECRYDGNWQLWSPCLSPQTWSGLSQGFHLFGVRAKDAANNVDPTPEYLTFTVDTVAPETILRSGPAAGSSTTSKTATFEVWSINGNGALQCSLDGGFVPNCRSPKTYTGLAPGTHTFRARAVVWAGNVDPTSATRTWTVLP